MLINLRVISSTKIQTKKPRQRITWMGKEKENLMSLNCNVLKKINPSNGHSKNVLSDLFKECVVCNSSRNGNYIVGLLKNGNLLTWHKDTEKSLIIVGTDVDLTVKYKENLNIYGNDTASRFLLIKYNQSTVKLYICDRQIDEHESENDASGPMISTGRWFELDPPIPHHPKCQSLTWDSTFIPATSCCHFSERISSAFVYTSIAKIHLTVVHINVNSLHQSLGYLPVYQFKTVTIPGKILEILAENVKDMRKSLVIRWSNDGKVLAVAINLKSTHRDYVIFASHCLNNVEIVRLPDEYSVKRHHRWICDMAWLCNDLFLILINRLGSICLMSRLGEALIISTHGCSMDLPPARFLNVHPLVVVRSPKCKDDNSDSVTLSADLLHQIFSVSSHPRFSCFLCSDGYMLTCFSLPTQAASPYSFVGSYLKHLVNLRRRLKKISLICDIEPDDELLDQLRVNTWTTLGLKSGSSAMINLQDNLAEFYSGDDSSLVDANFHHSSQLGKHDNGSIVMGSHSYDHLPKRNQTSILREHRKIIRSSFSIWGILLTTSTEWTSEWERHAISMTDHFVNVISDLTSPFESLSQLNVVYKVMSNWLNLCRFSCNGNVMVTVIKTFGIILKIILRNSLHQYQNKWVKKCVQLLILAESAIVVSDSNYTNLDGIPRNSLTLRLASVWYELKKYLSDLKVDDHLRNFILKKSRHHFSTKSCVLMSDCQVVLKSPGMWRTAIENWKSTAMALIADRINTKKVSQLLHAIMYLLLSNYEVKETILYIFWLISQISASGIRVKVIAKTLHSFALFLCDYLTGNDLIIYPFHHAHRLQHKCKSRCHLIKLDYQTLHKNIESNSTIAKHWSPDVAMAFLLHLGDLNRAFEFSEQLGEWKSSVLMKYTQFLLTENIDYAKMVENILVTRVLDSVNEATSKCLFTADIFITGALCDLHVTEGIFKTLFNKVLKSVFVPELPIIVPEPIYLPRPPFYCPQPELLDEDEAGDVSRLAEENWCRNISTLIQKFVEILKMANCHFISALPYLAFLQKSVNMTMEVRNVHNYIWPLEETFVKLKDTQVSIENEILGRIFRDICTICFFLHARDKLNMSLRRIRNCNETGYKSRLKAKDKACLDALNWATNLVCFNNVAGWEKENELHHIIVSTALEAPNDRRTTRFIAKNFSHNSTLPQTFAVRLQPLLEQWQNTVIRIGSDRFYQNRKCRKSLSVIHLEQCQEVTFAMRKLEAKLSHLEENVDFAESSQEWRIRPFELEDDYYHFLKIFLDILLLRDLPIDGGVKDKNAEIPLVMEKRKDIYNRYCILDTSQSIHEEKPLFMDRLNKDCDELFNVRIDKLSSQHKYDFKSSGLFQRPCDKSISVAGSKFVKTTNRSCLQFLYELTVTDNDINLNEHQMTRRILLWLLQWAKREKRMVKCHNLADSRNQFHTNLLQIYDVLKPKLSCNNLETKISLPKSGNEASNESLEAMNHVESNYLYFPPEPTKERFISSICLDLDSLNCEESDNETLSSSSEWTLEVESSPQSLDNLNNHSLNLVRSVSPSMNISADGTTISKPIGLGSLVVDGVSTTADDVSTYDEFGETEVSKNIEKSSDKKFSLIHFDQKNKHSVTSGRTTEISSSIPMLLKLDDEHRDHPDNRPVFLSLSDFERLNYTFKNTEVPHKNPYQLLQLITNEKPMKRHTVKMNKEVLAVPLMVSKSIQNTPNTKNVAISTLNGDIEVRSNVGKESGIRRQLTIKEPDEFPHFDMLETRPKVEIRSSFTQTDEEQGFKNAKLDEKDSCDVKVFNGANYSDTRQEAIELTEENCASIDNMLSHNQTAVADEKTSFVDIMNMRKRLEELKNEGILRENSFSEKSCEDFEIGAMQKLVTFVNVDSRSSTDMESENHKEIVPACCVGATSKLRYQNRKMLQEQHFKKRKDDALKLANEILISQKDISAPRKKFNSTPITAESSSSDTCSPWIVPDDVKTILSKADLSTKCQKSNFVDIADEYSDDSSSADSLLEELENDNIFKM